MNTLFPPLDRLRAWWSTHRTLLLFGVALLFGALAAFGARGYIAERIEVEKARLVPKHAMVRVVVARRDLERGEPVVPENMAVREVPAEYLPGTAIRAERFEHHLGARLDAPMRSGEPLLAANIVGADAGSFSSRIRQGIRAMSVLVDEVNSVSGMLQPGDRIDLLFSVRPPVAVGEPPAQEVTTTLMQDVAVLATGRHVRAGADDGGGSRHFTAITVEVSPAQAQQLIVAQRTGKLTAMLRHPDDRQPLGARALDLNALLGITPAARPALAQSPQRGPELIVGGHGALVALQLPAERSVARGDSPTAAPMPLPPPPPPQRSFQPPPGSSWSLLRPGAAAPAVEASTVGPHDAQPPLHPSVKPQ